MQCDGNACNRVYVCMSTVLTVFEPVFGTGQCIMSVRYVCAFQYDRCCTMSSTHHFYSNLHCVAYYYRTGSVVSNQVFCQRMIRIYV